MMDANHTATVSDPGFDDLIPTSKIQMLTSSSQTLKDDTDLLIVALMAVDLELREAFQLQGNALYVLSDVSVKNLILQSLNREISSRPFITLTLAQLIYRFTVATKFEVVNPVEKQLRINSWGVRYYNEVLSLHYSVSMNRLRREFKDVLYRSEANYIQLIQLLQSQNIDPGTAQKIKHINQNLTFRLVA